jgi:membrane protein YqaA with SNARE-associated domain
MFNNLMVPPVGLEPTHLTVLDFESSASTNSTTGAMGLLNKLIIPAGAPTSIHRFYGYYCFIAINSDKRWNIMIKPLRRLYDWTLRIAADKRAAWWLTGLAFIESSVFPLPPDVALVPMCVSRRDKAFHYAFICTLGSVLGGIFAYGIGFFLFESVGKAIVEFYGLTEGFHSFQRHYNEWGAWIVFGAGFTPIPYKVMTIASGVAQMNLPVFILASIAGRALRFYVLAGLLWKFGAPIQSFIEKYLGRLTILFFVMLIGGFICLKYLL